MALFTYQCIDKLGKKRRGKRRAETSAELIAALSHEGLFALSIKEKTPFLSRRLKRREKIELIGHLAELIDSGLPLLESLELLLAQSAEEKSSARYNLIRQLTSQISEGESFDGAIGKESAFSSLESAFIKTGIASGRLAASLASLKVFLERSEKLRRKIISAITYPIVLMTLALGAVSSLLLFAVPSIEEFVDMGSASTLTWAVISLSHALRDFGFWIACGFALGAFAIYWWLGLALRRLVCKVPMFRHFLDELALSRYCALVADLTSARVQLPDALALSRAALHGGPLKKVLEEIEERLRLGEGLDRLTLEKVHEKKLPAYVAQMVAVGQKSANIAGAFERMGSYYTERSYRRLETYAALIQPILLIVIGLLIGLIMLAILVPMTDLGVIN